LLRKVDSAASTQPLGATMTTTMISLLGLLVLQAPDPNPSNPPSAATPSEAPPPRGLGLIAGGTVFTLVGTGVTIGGISLFAEGARCRREAQGECWAGLGGAIMLPVGIIVLAIGAPMLGFGIRRNLAWGRWQREHGLALRPHVGRVRGAWMVGLELRF